MARHRFGALLVGQVRDERRRQAMYRMNEMELWNQRRHEVAREVEAGRLVRRAKATRFWGTLFGRMLEAPVRHHAESGGRA
jgi:hypothetical protein